MPIDASIIAGLRPAQFQQADPLDQYGKSLTLQNLMRQGKAADSALEDDEAVKAAYKNAGGDSKTLRGLLQSGGQYKQLQALDKLELDNAEKRSTIGKNDAAAAKSKYDVQIDAIQRGSSIMSTAKDQPSWDMARRVMSVTFPEIASQLPEQYDPAFVQGKLAAGQTLTQKLEDQRRQEATSETARGHTLTAASAEAGRKTTERGQDLTDKRQREANAVAAATANLKQRELTNTIETKNAAQEQAMSSYDTAIATLDRLAKHPGKQAAVGAGLGKTILPFVGPAPGSDRAGFMKELETFKAQTFLPMVQQLKGMGALSDAEGAKLSAAVGALHEDMPEKEFNASIKLIKQNLEKAKGMASRARTRPDASNKIGGVLTQNEDGSFDYGFK